MSRRCDADVPRIRCCRAAAEMAALPSWAGGGMNERGVDILATFTPVTITTGSFAFCRYTVAVLVWLSLVLQNRLLLILVWAIMVLSWLLRVGRAPLIVLYRQTIDRIWPSSPVVVDEKGIRFAHAVGAAFSTLCLVVLYLGSPLAGWILTAVLAILKTSAALGFCSALKLYTCMQGGNCCRVGKLARRLRP